jgi:ribosomal-protein-alanine N-acetyltransferase
MSLLITARTAIVRDAQPTHIPAIQALERSTPGAAHWDASHYVRVFDPSFPRRTLLIAEDQALAEAGGIGGFILSRIVSGEWEIENVVVATVGQRRGLGHLLLISMIERARRENATVLRLEVRASNAAAIGLYIKCGFRQDGLRPSYYSHPTEDAVLFSLSLRNSS